MSGFTKSSPACLNASLAFSSVFVASSTLACAVSTPSCALARSFALADFANLSPIFPPTKAIAACFPPSAIPSPNAESKSFPFLNPDSVPVPTPDTKARPVPAHVAADPNFDIAVNTFDDTAATFDAVPAALAAAEAPAAPDPIPAVAIVRATYPTVLLTILVAFANPLSSLNTDFFAKSLS